MEDPTRRRPPGSWPRDRPIRWSGVARNLIWFVVSSVAALAQLALVVPVLAISGADAGDTLGGAAGALLALVWGAATLFAAWSWLFGRWWIVAAPIGTVIAILIVARLG